MKTRGLFILVPLALVLRVFAADAAPNKAGTLFAGIAKLTDRKAADRGHIAEDIAKLASSTSGRTGVQANVPELIPFLKDEDDVVRYWIAMALGHIGAPAKDAVPALVVALGERVGDMGSKTSASGIRFALDRIDPTWRSRPDITERIKQRWPK